MDGHPSWRSCMGVPPGSRTSVIGLLAALLVTLATPAPARAQARGPEPLTLGAAIDRAVAANPAIAAARLGRAVGEAGVAVAAERLNPEASIEIERETPKQSFALAWPV